VAGRAPRRKTAGEAAAPVRRRARADRRRFAIVAARFNEPITLRLVDGARRAFQAAGIVDDAVDVYWVPGSFELPLAASRLADTGRFAALVCVGVVIRGQTPHFEHVAREAATGIREVAMRAGIPVTFGVITSLDEEQARDRAGGKVGNRGEEAAEAALEMVDLFASLGGRSRPRGPKAAR
jgi:6,7-dimethyl-8-ribityllumazine synthase